MKALIEIYNNWYRDGYMDEWPAWKKVRIFELISGLQLPKKGRALDFGCGAGVFTDVIKKALPEWEVYGSDLSDLAIDKAIERFPECVFLYDDAPELHQLRFDFIFSHHVLEHVENPAATAALLKELTASGAVHLHILPCGNRGSLEERLCRWVKGGRIPERGNAFFFEEEMHLQRFTSNQLTNLFEQFGFAREKALFANHHFGAVQWISAMSKQMVYRVTDPRNAINKQAVLNLTYYRLLLLSFYYLQWPYVRYGTKDSKAMQPLSRAKRLLYSISLIFKKNLDFLTEREWTRNNRKENGSEMYLFFKQVEPDVYAS